jgi:putative flavoprotein involved in K+ transport
MDGEFDVIIIGAGPAGLALGGELKRRAISFCVLERGAQPGESWRLMPRHLKLVSPWKASSLPGFGAGRWGANHEVTRAEYADYLKAYVLEQKLPVRIGVCVRAIRREGNRFVLETSTGEVGARCVVSATGYFQNPFIPPIAGMEQSGIPRFHSANYGSAPELAAKLGKAGASILIVGKRLSAGQILGELISAGFSVTLSHRTPIQFGSGPLGWWLFFRIYPWLESVKLTLGGPNARGFDVRMPGGHARKLIEGGTIRLFPQVRCFEGNTVVFENGESMRPDVVLFATGFRPVVDHLTGLGLTVDSHSGVPQVSGMESTDVPGLFFLGLDGLRNFQSRFIRGIRRDAVVLADRLVQRLG